MVTTTMVMWWWFSNNSDSGDGHGNDDGRGNAIAVVAR